MTALPTKSKGKKKIKEKSGRENVQAGSANVLNHSLNAAHSLGKLSSVRARPTYLINCRVNGTETHLLDKMPSVWAGPFTQQFIE